MLTLAVNNTDVPAEELRQLLDYYLKFEEGAEARKRLQQTGQRDITLLWQVDDGWMCGLGPNGFVRYKGQGRYAREEDMSPLEFAIAWFSIFPNQGVGEAFQKIHERINERMPADDSQQSMLRKMLFTVVCLTLVAAALVCLFVFGGSSP